MNKRIGIIFPNKSSSSETFIKAHVDYLPCEKKTLYGGWFPKYSDGDQLLFQRTFSDRARNKFASLVNKNLQTDRQFLAKKALLKYLRSNNLNAVLAEYGPTGVSVMDVCDQANLPLIVHFHGFDAYHFDTLAKYKTEYKVLFEKSRAIIAVSNDMRTQLISLGAPQSKVHYNSYGVDTSRFVQSRLPTSKPVFFFIGRFVNKKAPHLLILAFAKVRQAVPEARLIMGGDAGLGGSGELFSACRQLVKSLNISDAVDFKGALTPEEVAKEMQNSFAYVQHSVRPDSGDSEGTPNSILEAGAAGLPVISTRHGGIKDVIIEGKTGYLVEEYDIEAMAERMIELVKNPGVASAMGKASRRNIEDNFTMGKSIGQLWNIIENVISER